MSVIPHVASRRAFLHGSAALAGLAWLAGCAPVRPLVAGAAKATVATGVCLKVEHEWDTLREAVVGYPHIRIGDGVPKAVSNYMPAEMVTMAAAMLATNSGKLLAEALPMLHEAAVAQMDAAIEILRKRDVIVHQVLPPTPDEEAFLADLGYHNNMLYFPRDPIVVIGDTFIETAMFNPARRMERFPIRRTLAERLEGCRVVALPEPMPVPEDAQGGYGPGPFLEGGDIFVIGKDIYVGHTGNASNRAGIDALQALLGAQYRVHEVRLSSTFLHLDCVLSMPRPGLAIVCREGFLDGLPAFLDDWDLIEISPEDAEEKLATNVLVLDTKTDLVAAESPEVAEALAKAGQEVITTPFSAVFLWGGAFRCWHHPLIRDSDL
jgi:N-dimethylarginine dimethylaminohydrolase